MFLYPANNKMFKDYIRREHYGSYNMRSNDGCQSNDNCTFLSIKNNKEVFQNANKTVMNPQPILSQEAIKVDMVHFERFKIQDKVLLDKKRIVDLISVTLPNKSKDGRTIDLVTKSKPKVSIQETSTEKSKANREMIEMVQKIGFCINSNNCSISQEEKGLSSKIISSNQLYSTKCNNGEEITSKVKKGKRNKEINPLPNLNSKFNYNVISTCGTVRPKEEILNNSDNEKRAKNNKSTINKKIQNEVNKFKRDFTEMKTSFRSITKKGNKLLDDLFIVNQKKMADITSNNSIFPSFQ